jgi:ectoine hydroxylase-related dioxygenase (phytanoyl-CoA dioxygenase family)
LKINDLNLRFAFFGAMNNPQSNPVMITTEQLIFFNENGYLAFENLLTPAEVSYFRGVYDDFLNGAIVTGDHRSDLSGMGDGKRELITQIMRPSVLLPALEHSSLHRKALDAVRQLMGDDMALDFDMLIDKAPHTNTPTPWHQDEAYWIDMPDKRAVSVWVALDPAVQENGSMWFVPGSQKLPLRPHRQTGNGGALQCEAAENEAVAVALQPGSCTFHHGRTIHYSRGNSTGSHRRAFILNFRPAAMVAYERERGFDHLGKREVRQ